MLLRAERFDLAIGEIFDGCPEPLTQEKTGPGPQRSTPHSPPPPGLGTRTPSFTP
jgi:hypothetical protein